MIKVCYIIGQLGKGGAERQLYELVRGINKERFNPIVICLSEGGYWSKEIKKIGIEVIEIMRKRNWEFIRLFKLFKLLKSIKPDIVHAFLFSANSYGRIASILAGVPIIIASERNLPEAGNDKIKLWIYIDKLLALFTDRIICNSYRAAESLVKHHAFNSKKVCVVHNGISVADFINKNDLNSEEYSASKVVGTVGRLYPQKNHILFLDMVKIISEKYKHKNLKFVIAGEGPLKKQLKKYSQDLGIESKVVFTGLINNIQDILHATDIFVLSSDWEGLPNAVMEAMASGLPCVVTDVGGNSELVVDGETGYVIPPNDPEAMAQKISYLLENDRLAIKMGVEGKKRMQEDFNMEKMIKTTEEIYEKMINGKVYHA